VLWEAGPGESICRLQLLQVLLLLLKQCGHASDSLRMHTVMSIHLGVTIMTSLPLHQYLQYLILLI